MARPTRKSRTLEFDQEGLIVGLMLFLFVGPTKMIFSEIPFLKRSFFPVSRDFARYVSGLWALFRTFQYYAQENCPKNTGPVPRVALYVSGQLRGFSQLFVLIRSRALRCKHRSAICADFAAPIYRYIGVISDDLRCDSKIGLTVGTRLR